MVTGQETKSILTFFSSPMKVEDTVTPAAPLGQTDLLRAAGFASAERARVEIT